MDKQLKNTTTQQPAIKNPVTQAVSSPSKTDYFATDPKTQNTVISAKKSRELSRQQEEQARRQKELALKAEAERKRQIPLDDPVAKKLVDKVNKVDPPRKQLTTTVDDEKLKKKITVVNVLPPEETDKDKLAAEKVKKAQTIAVKANTTDVPVVTQKDFKKPDQKKLTQQMQQIKKPEKIGLKPAVEDSKLDSPARRTTIRDKAANTTLNDLNAQFPLKKNYTVNVDPNKERLKNIEKNKLKDIEIPKIGKKTVTPGPQDKKKSVQPKKLEVVQPSGIVPSPKK